MSGKRARSLRRLARRIKRDDRPWSAYQRVGVQIYLLNGCGRQIYRQLKHIYTKGA
jgi:hypothetical protein